MIGSAPIAPGCRWAATTRSTTCGSDRTKSTTNPARGRPALRSRLRASIRTPLHGGNALSRSSNCSRMTSHGSPASLTKRAVSASNCRTSSTSCSTRVNRPPIGATVGQSLPNWGPVAETGGRTVTMTNLYTDDDSQKTMMEKMSSLFCSSSMKLADPKPSLMGIVLHEAAHNLGPAHDYKVNGKVDTAIFGGPLAATLEELKAQTAALYL